MSATTGYERLRVLRTARLRLAAALAAAFFAPASPAATAAMAPDLQARLEASAPGARIPVIVGLGDRIDPKRLPAAERVERRRTLIRTLRDHAAQSQPPLVSMMQARGGRRIKSLWAINAIAAELPVAAIEALARHPAVARIRLDAEVPAPGAGAAAAAEPEWNVTAVRAPELWAQGYDGTGVVVASLDTGVDAAHPDLSLRWRGGGNSWYDPNGQHAAPYDTSGHGTQTMGLMVGGNAGGSAIGIAPGAQWIAAKIFNDAGQATLSNIHLAFQWLLDPDGNPASDDAPHVVNNSWGLNGPDQCYLEFQTDIQLLKAAGIAVVFAAGNDGPSGFTSSSPANNPEGYAVGAVAADDSLAWSSSRGPSACDGTVYPELVAPGVAVQSADLSFGGMPLYVAVTGTSFAAPHVSGALALLAQAHPDADVAQLEGALLQSARDLGAVGPDLAYGHGMLDALGANEVLGGVPPPLNYPPTASADVYSVAAGSTLWMSAPGVLGNDGDPDGDELSALLENPPTGGTLALNADGSFSYTPDTGTLADSFSYRASDGSLASDAASVSISVIQPAPPPVLLYFSTAANTAVPGTGGTADDADIYSWDGTSFSRVLDATAVGLPSAAFAANVDGLKVIGTRFYLSFSNTGVAVPGLGTVPDEDIVVYDSSTGTWSLFFDGSAAGLTTDDEDVDAFDILTDGSVLVSTLGNVAVPGLAGTWADEDVLRCAPTSNAPIASCTWSVHFDGSDVTLTNASEDVDGVAEAAGKLYLGTLGAYGVTGLSGGGGDVFSCDAPATGPASSCASFTLYFRASQHGLAGVIDAFSLP